VRRQIEKRGLSEEEIVADFESRRKSNLVEQILSTEATLSEVEEYAAQIGTEEAAGPRRGPDGGGCDPVTLVDQAA